MRDNKFIITGSTWTCRYLSMSSIRLMMLLSTPAQRITISPKERRYCAEKSLDSKTRSGLQNFIEVLRVLDIMCGVIFFHLLFGVMSKARGLKRCTEFFCRWSVHLRSAVLGHRSRSPKDLWQIFLLIQKGPGPHG